MTRRSGSVRDLGGQPPRSTRPAKPTPRSPPYSPFPSLLKKVRWALAILRRQDQPIAHSLRLGWPASAGGIGLFISPQPKRPVRIKVPAWGTFSDAADRRGQFHKWT